MKNIETQNRFDILMQRIRNNLITLKHYTYII